MPPTSPPDLARHTPCPSPATLDFAGPPPQINLEDTPSNDPQMRLVSRATRFRPSLEVDRGQAIRGTADPRWVLAVRASEQLQGATLTPPSRDRLVRMAQTLGLTAFDAHLIIAVVQDQARRGYAPSFCPTAGEPQLRMVPLPAPRPWPWPRVLRVTLIFSTLLALEIVAVRWCL